MPGFTCCVPGCYNNSQRHRDLRFYIIPKDPTAREIWLKNISRSGVNGCFSTFQPTTGHRVCSVHFLGGRKTYNIRIPTIFPLWGVNEKKRGGRGKKTHAVLPTARSLITVDSTAVNADITSQNNETPESTNELHNGQDRQEDIKPVDLTLQGDETCLTAVVCCSTFEDNKDPQVFETVTTDERRVLRSTFDLSALTALTAFDHPYSVPKGTTPADLLRKLNEQRDVIALMEVKMKELKSTVYHLRVTEARLMEEIRERDAMLSKSYLTLLKKV